MAYIIDAYNLIGAHPHLVLGEVDVELKLIKILQEFCRQYNNHCVVYFDNAAIGMAGTIKHGRVTVHYVDKRTEADDAIGKKLNKLGNSAKNFTVVSDDNKVKGYVRRNRAKHIGTNEFLRLLDPNPDRKESSSSEKPDPPTSKEDLDEWMQIFSKEN